MAFSVVGQCSFPHQCGHLSMVHIPKERQADSYPRQTRQIAAMTEVRMSLLASKSRVLRPVLELLASGVSVFCSRLFIVFPLQVIGVWWVPIVGSLLISGWVRCVG